MNSTRLLIESNSLNAGDSMIKTLADLGNRKQQVTGHVTWHDGRCPGQFDGKRCTALVAAWTTRRNSQTDWL